MNLKPAQLVLVTGFVVLLFNSGARFAMGLMLHPMALDLGWSRTTLSSTVTVFMIVSASALPFAGQLVDRLGPRSVLAFGVVVSGIAISLMGLIETPIQALVLYGVVFAIGSAATSVTPIGVIVTRWYPERAGMANSIAISGMGIGQLLIISVLATQLVVLGWRGAFVALGLVSVICVLPLVLASGRGAPPTVTPDRSRGPPEDGHAGNGVRIGAKGESAKTLRQALGRGRLWVILLVYAICGFQDFLIATHVVAFALDEGVGSLLAGNMLAFMGLAGLIGVLIAGAVNDRYGPVLPTAICFMVRIAIFALVLVSRDDAVIVVVALLYGLTFWITAPLAVVFARSVGGFALLGTLSGLITMVHHIAGGAGAYFGARIFDALGSYDHALLTLLVMSVLALVLTPALRVGR